MINTTDLHTIERHLRDTVSKEGYTKVFGTLDQFKNVWVNGTITLSFDHRSVVFKKHNVELVEHGFKGYEYIIQTLKNNELPILTKWYESQK